MSTVKVACPKCKTEMIFEGLPGEKKQVECRRCKSKGIIVFPKSKSDQEPAGITIKVTNVTKYYGKHCGVENITFFVKRGEIFGFLGPNGAGKTTTIRTCLNLIYPNSGTITIFGMDAQKESVKIRRKVGYLPGEFGLLPNVKVQSYLNYLLSLSNCKSNKKMLELSQRLDLDLQRKTHELSRGNRQKVGVIQALMADQDLIILDEPTTGLDPLMQHEFYKIIREEQINGKTVFMSSHILPEVEAVCDRVAIIKDGQIKMIEEIATLKQKTGKILEVEFRKSVNKNEFNISGVSEIIQDGSRFTLTIHSNLDSVIKIVANHPILNMNLRSYSLEQLFLKYYGSEQKQPDTLSKQEESD